jgi:hypothetical protein
MTYVYYFRLAAILFIVSAGCLDRKALFQDAAVDMSTDSASSIAIDTTMVGSGGVLGSGGGAAGLWASEEQGPMHP